VVYGVVGGAVGVGFIVDVDVAVAGRMQTVCLKTS